MQNNKNTFNVSIQYQSSNVNDNLILLILKRGVMTFIGAFQLVSQTAYCGNNWSVTLQALNFLLSR